MWLQEIVMKMRILALAVCLLTLVTMAAADEHSWQTGTLTATERQKVQEGSTIMSNTDGSAKDRGNATGYSQNTTTSKTDNYDNYQVYTIESGNTIYVASEHLMFPWSKPASIILGKPVKFAVENNNIFILDDDDKQHKATLIKTALKQAN
jgi:hypothetical protein